MGALQGWTQPFLSQVTPQVSWFSCRKGLEVWSYKHQSVWTRSNCMYSRHIKHYLAYSFIWLLHYPPLEYSSPNDTTHHFKIKRVIFENILTYLRHYSLWVSVSHLFWIVHITQAYLKLHIWELGTSFSIIHNLIHLTTYATQKKNHVRAI